MTNLEELDKNHVAFLEQAKKRGARLRALADGLCRRFKLEPSQACAITLDWLRAYEKANRN